MNTANHVFEYPLSAGVKGEAVVQQFGITMSEEETMPVEQDDLAEQTCHGKGTFRQALRRLSGTAIRV